MDSRTDAAERYPAPVDHSLRTKTLAARFLAATGVVLAVLYASTLGGMGRDVGGRLVTTAYTFVCLFAWPVGFFLSSRPFDEDSRRSGSVRRFGYVSAPVLYVGIAMWTPHSVWERLGLTEIWFNYFGEAQVFTQGLKGVAYAALTALLLEQLRRLVRKRRSPVPAK